MRQLLLVLMLCILPFSGSWANTLKYDSLRIGHNDGQVRVVLDLGGPTKIKYFSLPKPNRFVVDVLDVIRTGSKQTIDLNNTPIKHIRTGIRKGDDLRMVIELDESTEGKAFVVPPSGGKGHRLVIELDAPKSQKVAKKSPPKSVPVAAVSKAAAKQISQPTRTALKATASSTSSAVASKKADKETPRLMIKREVVKRVPPRDLIIAIDAGHGGIDVGAIGYKGTREKDVVLAIARKLEILIKKEPGMRPLMIRDDDTFVSLRNRMNKARAHKADMFISIHADAFPDKRAKGSSVYALSQHGATTEAARFLADSENASDLIGGVTLDDKDELLASVLLDLSQNATIEASLDVAGRVLNGLKQVGKVHKQRVEQAGFAVLKSPDIPSILIETAFISNPREEKNLNSSAYQNKLALAVQKGIRSYFAHNPPPGTHIAAVREREHIIKYGDTLSGIAHFYNVSMKTLRTANRLNTDRLHVGQVLQIPNS
ncbi:N-acetylmuramoyl-L-alanine amidase [Pseudomonadota bacterium]